MITLIEQSESLPVATTSWTKLFQTDKFYNLRNNDPVDYDFTDDTVKKGVLINIGGANYKAVSDTAITGTASEYVKIDSSGNASYVEDLDDVDWNDTYNFYADGAGNAYLFNIAKAVSDGVITSPKTKWGMQALLGYFKDLVVKGSATITGFLTVDGKILPTTTLAEYTTSTLASDSEAEILPRGVFDSAKLYISVVTNVGSPSYLYLESLIDGTWETINSVGGTSVGVSSLVIPYTIFSTGSNKRVRFTLASGSGSTGYATLYQT